MTAPVPPGIWRLDAARSRIGFAIRKHGFGTVHGRFADASAEITVSDRVAIEGAVSVASIDTGSGDRDAHLRGPGFFAADEHPVIAFAATRIEPGAAGWEITGPLVIRGTSREVTLRAQPSPPDGTHRHRLRVAGEIDRRDFGLSWNRAVEASGVVGAAVRIELELEFERVREVASARPRTAVLR